MMRIPTFHQPTDDRATAADAIRVQNVGFAYGDRQVLDGASLTLEAGKSLALLGANGAGKSTFVDLLVGLIRPDQGHIRTLGRNPTEARYWLTRRMSVVRQSLPFSDRLKVKDVVRLYSGFYGLSRGAAIRIFADLGLEDNFNSFIDELSGGQKQRLSLAIGLMNQPELLVLDEPSSGLDLSAYDLLVDTIARMKRERGIALLVISHVPDFVERTCDEVAFIRAGKISEAMDIGAYLNHSKGRHVVELQYDSASGLDAIVDLLTDEGYKARTQSGRVLCHEVDDPELLLRVIREGGDQHQHPVPARHSVRQQDLKSLYFEMTGEESGNGR